MISFSGFAARVCVYAAVTQSLSCQPCLYGALTVNYIMSRNGDDISRWWVRWALEARAAHGCCPCWRHYRDSTHK